MGFKKAFSRFFGINQEQENLDQQIENEAQIAGEDESTAEGDKVLTSPAELTDEATECREQSDVVQDSDSEMAQNDFSEKELSQQSTEQEDVQSDCQLQEEFQEDSVEDESSETDVCGDESIVEPENIVEEDNVVEADNTVPKKSIFAKLFGGLEKTRKSFNDKIDNVLKMFKSVDEELYEELEEALIMADVGVDTSLYIIEQLRERVKEKKIKESEFVKQEIEDIIAGILSENNTTLRLETTPSVIMVIGVNGVGKTTSIGKLASKFKSEGKKVILGAADTFRAAAIDQLVVWANRSGVDIVKHQEGSDPAAVVYDTISAAKARGADVIILDTAGRLHNKKNLMDELNKIYRVMERELPGCSKETLLVVDATTGQNAVNQVKLFGESTDITGIILTKLDGSAKGGIVLAIAHEEKIPVKLVGVGEGVEDLQVFDSKDFASALFAQD